MAGVTHTFVSSIPDSGTPSGAVGPDEWNATHTADAYPLTSGGITTDSSTARTLSAGDNGKVLYFTSGSAITLSMASGLGAGFSCAVVQGGAGQITFAANSQTMTVGNGASKTSAVGAMALIIACEANTFFISGSLA